MSAFHGHLLRRCSSGCWKIMWTFLKISLRQFISLAARKFTTSRRRCHVSLISRRIAEKSRSRFEGAIKRTQVCRKHPAKRFAMTLCNEGTDDKANTRVLAEMEAKPERMLTLSRKPADHRDNFYVVLIVRGSTAECLRPVLSSRGNRHKTEIID